MKTYEEVIEFSVSVAFDYYMGGSNNPLQDVSLRTLSFIFDKPKQEIADAILEGFTRKIQEYKNEL